MLVKFNCDGTYVPFDACFKQSLLCALYCNYMFLVMHNFHFSALTLLVGWQEGNLACRKLSVGLLVVTI